MTLPTWVQVCERPSICVLVACTLSVSCTPTSETKGEEPKEGGGASSATPSSMGSTPSVAPLEASLRTVEPSEAMVAEGGGLFAACSACHGTAGEGRTGIGPSLNSESFLAAASDRFLIQTIAEGRAGTTMIPWKSSYTEEQIRSLVAFIRTFNDVEPAELDDSPVDGDAEAGAIVYRDICAACHGRTGAGYQETANGTGIGRKAFLDSVSNGFLRYIIKHGKSDTAMRGFDESDEVAVANLSDAQIENVIAYLRQQAW